MFYTLGMTHKPKWCVQLGNTSKGIGMCSKSAFNISKGIPNNFTHTGQMCSYKNQSLNNTISELFTYKDTTSGILVGKLVSAALGPGAEPQRSSLRSFSLGNNTCICYGKMCYPWIPAGVKGWCYLAVSTSHVSPRPEPGTSHTSYFKYST